MRPPPDLPDAARDSNPARAEAHWPPAVIAGGYQTGVLGLRSLVRRGVRATCIETAAHRDYPAFQSRYGRAVSCPDPDVDPSEWVEFMVALARTLGGKPVLIPSADQFVSAIAAHADELVAHYTLSPGVANQGLLAGKRTQYELAAKYRLPLPRTHFVASAAEAQHFADGARFPCLLKPIHFREWQAFPREHPLANQKVGIAGTPAELVQLWRLASAVNPTTIAQEIIEGPDTAKRVYFACYNSAGRRIAHAMFRELRCDPLGFGPATVSEPVVDDETDAICDRFLQALGYRGVCEMEMKRDTRDGRVKLIEANPRLTGGGDAALYAGVDVPWLHYLDLIGQPVRPVEPDHSMFRHVVLRSDVSAIIAYRRAGLLSWTDVLRSYQGRLAFYDFDPSDWRYSAATVYHMGRAAVAGLVRSFLPHSSTWRSASPRASLAGMLEEHAR